MSERTPDKVGKQRTYEEQVHFMNRQAQMLAEEGNDVSERVMMEALAMLAVEHHRAEEAEAAVRALRAIIKELEQEIRAAARGAAAEERWKQVQGDEYGSY